MFIFVGHTVAPKLQQPVMAKRILKAASAAFLKHARDLLTSTIELEMVERRAAIDQIKHLIGIWQLLGRPDM